MGTPSSINWSTTHAKNQLQSCSIVNVILVQHSVVFQLYRLPYQMLLRNWNTCIYNNAVYHHLSNMSSHHLTTKDFLSLQWSCNIY